MIPANITRAHLRRAIEKIRSKGVPSSRQSTKFDLLFEGTKYPPKYVISLANLLANNKILSPEVFSGGAESNRFLTARGFQIIPKSEAPQTEPPLRETSPPAFQSRVETAKNRRGLVTDFDFAEAEARNRELGLAGELLVLEHEKETLRDAGRADLLGEVRHVPVSDGDGAGYDILSISSAGDIKYIEVKTTRGSAESSFLMSSNEVEFSKRNSEQFYLYRVYEYDAESNSGKFYVVRGSIENSFNVAPASYRVSRT